MSSDQANQAADAILALINSRPQSPSKEEIAVLIDRIANPHRLTPSDELESGTAFVAKWREQEREREAARLYEEAKREWMIKPTGIDGWLERQQWTPDEVQQMKLRQQTTWSSSLPIMRLSGRNGR